MVLESLPVVLWTWCGLLPLEDVDELRWAIGSRAPGETVRLRYLRDGVPGQVDITLGRSQRRHRRSL